MSTKTAFKNYNDLTKNLPSEVKTIFKIFNQNSGNDPDLIRLVGGCVRDLIIQKEVNDFDFATKLEPKDIIQLLENNKIKAIPTGINYGTVTAVINYKNFEITTLRKDNEPDGRHLKAEFVNDYYLDAARRDFTINALYLDDRGQIHDYFNGIEDIKNKKVKFIGDAKTRITEDYLRILRFFRFSCFYSKEFDHEGLKNCIDLKSNLKKLSGERIRIEIFKIFSCMNRLSLIKTIQILNESDISKEIIGTQSNFNHRLISNLFLLEERIFSSQNGKIKSLYQKPRSDSSKIFNNNYLLPFLTAIYNCNSDVAADLKTIADKLKLTNKEKNYCQFLNKTIKCYHNPLDQQQLHQLLTEYNQELVIDFYLFNLSMNFDIKNSDNLNQIIQNFDLIANFTKPNFPINGNDITKLGYEGKEVGKILEMAKAIWIKSNFSLNKDKIIETVMNFKNSL